VLARWQLLLVLEAGLWPEVGLMAKPYPRMVGMYPYYPVRRKTPEALIVAAMAPQRFTLYCCCDRKRPDGGCGHADAFLDAMKPWYRSRTKVVQREDA
jgi:hypothetical protein